MITETEFSFFIEGTPAPGGSKNAFVARRGDGSFVTRPDGSPVVNVSDAGGKALKTWRKVVAWAAKSMMMGSKPYEGPIQISFVFYMRRPLSHFGTGRNAATLKPDAPKYHAHAPDALKLTRGTEDSLTGVIWKDDGQNVVVRSEKRYCAPGEKPGCAVRFRVL